jgi:choice-of-anchor B domain-containing protein
VKQILTAILLLFINLCYTQQSYNIELLDHWTDTTLLKGAEDAYFSDVWGFEFANQNYVALGSTEGTHIFKISNKKLIKVDFKAGKFSSPQVQHRDFKTYKNYLYSVCDEGASSLQIFDLSTLPDSIHKVYDSNQYFQICHNIFIDTLKAKLYACGTDNQGMKVFDIQNPTQPQLFYEYTQNYVHDCYVTNDTAFLNCGFDGLQIYNFESTPIQQLGLLDFYAGQGYNHSGWLTKDRKKYLFIDETKGKKVKICNSESLIDIEVSSLYGTKKYENAVAHNVQIFNDFAFISYYNEGLRVVDIKTDKPKEVGFYDTFHQSTNYKLNGAWGVFVFEKEELILVSDRQNGLFLCHFPIQLYRNLNNNTITSNTPFIDENSKLIYQSDDTNLLTFSIYDMKGHHVYLKETLNDWINIPLTLSSGGYLYLIQNYFGDVVSQGKFVIVN